MPRRLTHLPQLDGLRAFAVAAVFLVHYTGHPLLHAVDPGFLGVRLFFVLSGFLITRILLTARDGPGTLGEDLQRFYVRRSLRIFPAYYLLVAVLYALDVEPMRASVGWHLGYLSNVWYARIDTLWGSFSPFWTLAVEEQFYLVWPLLLLACPPRHTRAVIAGAVALGVAFRAGALGFGYSPFQSGVLTPACLDALGLGALLGLTWHEAGPEDGTPWIARSGLAFGVPLAALVVAADAGLRFHEHASAPLIRDVLLVVKQPLVCWAFVWVVDAAARGFRGLTGRVLLARPVQYAGKISYGLYLYHAPMADVVAMGARALSIPQPTGTMGFVLKVGLSVGVAALSWKFVEAPVVALKKRFEPSSPAPNVPEAAPIERTAVGA